MSTQINNDILLAMDEQLLREIQDKHINYKRLPIWRTLLKKNYSHSSNTLFLQMLTFEKVFDEPVGYHLMKLFLLNEGSVNKATFINDVKIYKQLHHPTARKNAANKIYQQFCAPQIYDDNKGSSVFITNDFDIMKNIIQYHPQLIRNNPASYNSILFTQHTNSIDIDRDTESIKQLQHKLTQHKYDSNIFDELVDQVYQDLRTNVFPRFCQSPSYKMLLRCKRIEQTQISLRSFDEMRMLGSGAFGCVSACKKKDTGKLYAMKKLNKRRVCLSTSLCDNVILEKDILSKMDCKFVTTLKYSFMDDKYLYLIMDLMLGGDLKYHLNRENVFSEYRTKFYAGEILLGLEHIHSKGYIYSDLKLENILLDDKGHCKISDFGLATKIQDGKLVNGYGGTLGYMAPEIVLKNYYNHMVDFFAFGVLIYRCLSGKKPFCSTRVQRRTIEVMPTFHERCFDPLNRSLLKGLLCKNSNIRIGCNGINEIKMHPWFDTIDFGLLEIGNLKPPFIPSLNQIHAERVQDINMPKNKMNPYSRIKNSCVEKLKLFSYTSNKAIQEEIVDVLKRVKVDGK
eukprot:32248_1